jgi:hypothetical protein
LWERGRGKERERKRGGERGRESYNMAKKRKGVRNLEKFFTFKVRI